MSFYVMVRKQVPSGPHLGRVLENLQSSAQHGYEILKRHGAPQQSVLSSLDDARYGPIEADFGANQMPGVQADMKPLGFSLDGPFNKESAEYFVLTGYKLNW